MENIAIHRTPQFQQITPEAVSSRNPVGSSIIQGSSTTSPPQRDRVLISDEARETASAKQAGDENGKTEQKIATQGASETADLSKEEMLELQKLQKRDTEVKAHEQAHKAVAGHHAAGGPSYTYEIGPNGKRFAVGGEVPIDLSKEATPEETILKMQIIARAAMAPANPSSADRRIAARAAMIANQARGELQTEQSGSTAKNNKAEDVDTSNDANTTKTSENGLSLNPDSSPVSHNTRRAVLSAYSANTV